MKFGTYLPVPNHGGPMSAHLGLVLHVQEGNGGLQGWFSNPESDASSTWWVSKTGEIQNYVDTELQAWAQGAGNATYNSVETEGFTNEPLTTAQISGLAQIYAWGMSVYHWPATLSEAPGAAGFGWHGMGGMAWGNHPGCPGDIRRAQRQLVLDEVHQAPISEEDVMDIAGTPSGAGYYILKPDGAVEAFGDAVYKGGVNNAGQNQASAMIPGDTATSISVSEQGGYWVICAPSGAVYAFGGAKHYGNAV